MIAISCKTLDHFSSPQLCYSIRDAILKSLFRTSQKCFHGMQCDVSTSVLYKSRLQNSLFLRREIENPSAFIKWELGRGNGRADGSEKEWGEGLKKETVAFAYFKSVLEFSVPQETLNSHWLIFDRSCQTHYIHQKQRS